MRITDRLEGGIISDVLECDDSERRMASFCALVTDITKVNFRVWSKKSKNGDRTEKDWTDLAAYKKRSLLRELPAQ